MNHIELIKQAAIKNNDTELYNLALVMEKNADVIGAAGEALSGIGRWGKNKLGEGLLKITRRQLPGGQGFAYRKLLGQNIGKGLEREIL